MARLEKFLENQKEQNNQDNKKANENNENIIKGLKNEVQKEIDILKNNNYNLQKKIEDFQKEKKTY